MFKRNVVNRISKITLVDKDSPTIISDVKSNSLILKSSDWEYRVPSQGTISEDVSFGFMHLKDALKLSSNVFRSAASTFNVTLDGFEFLNQKNDSKLFSYNKSSASPNVFDIGDIELIYSSSSASRDENQWKNIEYVGDDVLKVDVKLAFDITNAYYIFNKGNINVVSSNGFTGHSAEIAGDVDINFNKVFSVSSDASKLLVSSINLSNTSDITISYSKNGYLVVDSKNDSKKEYHRFIIKVDEFVGELPEALNIRQELNLVNQISLTLEQRELINDRMSTEFFNSTDNREFKSIIFRSGVMLKLKPSRRVIKSEDDESDQQSTIEEYREVFSKYEAINVPHDDYLIPLYWLRKILDDGYDDDGAILDVYYTKDKIVISNEYSNLKVWTRRIN